MHGEDSPPGPSVLDLIARSVTAAPTALAVAAPDGCLAYAELNERAEAVADRLRALGAGPGSLIGLWLNRSAGLVAAALGILKTGAAYVALDPGAPVRRAEQLLADCGALALITDDRWAAVRGGDAGASVPGVGDLHRLPAARAVAEAPVDGVAYVNFTSGSTGRPRAVMVGSAGLVNLVRWHCRTFGVTPHDRATQLANPAFDAFAWDVWPCLAAGATLCIPDDEVTADPAALRDWLVHEQITVSFVPTPVAELLLELDWPATASLRTLLTGGDRLHRGPRAGLPFDLINNYGVTEAAVVSTSGLVAPGPAAGPPSIGKPIDGVDIRVVDTDLDDVPAGDPGELLVGGVSVALGYLGEDELTAERFVIDTRDSEPSQRWYRTGDVVRVRTDGALEYLSRLDDQVQVHGQRVEPGEIVAVLDTHPSIVRSVVVTVDDPAGDRRLVGYVQPGTGSDQDTDAVRAHLLERLPRHMVPTDLVWLDELPLSANGKVDRSRLRPPPVGRDASAPAPRPPEGHIEAAVAEIVADLLGRDQVGPDEDFILLGGHSLLAARLVVRLADRFGVELPLRSVFERATVCGIAAEVLERLIAEIGALTDEEAAQRTEVVEGG